MIYLFIGQAMGKRKAEDIKKTREWAIFQAIQKLSKESDCIEVLDTFYPKCDHERNPLWFLSKTIVQLSKADYAYFTPDWKESRASRIQHQIAIEYGVNIIGD